MPQRHKYLNYTTPWGVSLSSLARSGWSSFLIHESGYQEALADWNHQGVDSPFWRLYHNPKPGCHLRFQDRDISLSPDRFVLIPANTIFDCCGPVLACHFWLHFTVTRLAGTVKEQPILVPVNPVLQTLVDAVITAHQAEATHPRNHRLQHQSAALLHAVFAEWEPLDTPALPDRLLEVLELIQKAPHTDLSNLFLAERAVMRLERFIRTFREHVGVTPAAYVTKIRLRFVEEALALTEKTIDQIAVENGFPNRHYLTRLFARHFGCGPAEFRARQHRKRGR